MKGGLTPLLTFYFSLIFFSKSITLSSNSLFDCISNATNFSYLTALYPLFLVVTTSGNIDSISWAIIPISCPVWP